MSEEVKELTGKQKAFADYYLSEAHFNGTKASELAEYKGNRSTLAAVAYENLRKPHIRKYIDERLEAMTMPANVVLTRLTEYAEGDIKDLCDGEGNFSFEIAKKNRKTGLIKKLKRKRTLKQKKTETTDSMRQFLAEDEIEDIETEVEVIYEEVEFELHSSHEALRDLGKFHKLFTDKVDIEANVNLKSLDEFNKEAEQRLKAVEKAVKKRNE